MCIHSDLGEAGQVHTKNNIAICRCIVEPGETACEAKKGSSGDRPLNQPWALSA